MKTNATSDLASAGSAAVPAAPDPTPNPQPATTNPPPPGFRSLYMETALANEIHSAKGNLYVSLSCLEQAQAMEKLIPGGDLLAKPTGDAIDDVKRALSNLSLVSINRS